MMQLTAIGDVFEFVKNGLSIQQDDNASGFPITRIETIWNSSIDINRFGYANIEDLEKYKNHLLNEGDILMTHINSPKHLGKCAIYIGIPSQLIHGMNLLNLRPKMDIVFPKYIHFYLNSDLFKIQLRKISNQSVNQASFSAGNLKKLKIPLPPLETQKQIAQVLETADQLRKDCQQVEQELNALAQSVFLEMFGDPVTNPKGWEIKRLKEISRIQIGPFGTQLHKEDYIENGIPLINPTHIKNGKIIPNSKLTIPLTKHEELPQYHLEVGDIIMGRRGEMGRCAVITEREESWLCGTGSLFIRPHNSGIFSDYLCKLLSGKAIKSHLEAESQGATMLNLNKTIIGSINIPVPSENALKMFSKAQEILANNIDLSKSSSYELLFNSLLQKAFKGELNLKSTEQA